MITQRDCHRNQTAVRARDNAQDPSAQSGKVEAAVTEAARAVGSKEGAKPREAGRHGKAHAKTAAP